MKEPITIQTTVNAPIEKVWAYWTEPEHITQWSFASADWHSPSATNDLRVDGEFSTRMESKDGAIGFDFGGKYTEVDLHKKIAYTLDDDRKVTIEFDENENGVTIIETFDPENENPIEMQRDGWQTILENFKTHVEN